MSSVSMPFLKKAILSVFTLTLFCPIPAFSQSQFKVLYDFNGPDGAWPQSLIFDHSGNLYGSTLFGGNDANACNSNGCGTVFELVPNPDGSWKETVLYAFCSVGLNCTDGYYPSTGLIFDEAGNLYGTTSLGGANGSGEVFELTPNGQGGTWTLHVLYSFCPLGTCEDGRNPAGGLAMDAAGNLYGTTASGGKNDFNGTVFELSPPVAQGDPWTESVLYNFCSNQDGRRCLDGFIPGGVTLSSLGNLYGSTVGGGQYSCNEGCGTVYKLSPSPSGWNYTLLYAPSAKEGGSPNGPLLVNSVESVYGAFSDVGGNESGSGALFRVVANGHHSSLPLNPNDGTFPRGPLVFGKGVIYGSAFGIGSIVPGTIFRVSDSGEEKVLHTFCSMQGCPDGIQPGGLIKDDSGTLFGVAAGGGNGNHGLVFALRP